MTNRRGFFGGLLALLGFGTLVKAEPVEKKTKGLLIHYINVGQLPPFKAEAFIERWKDRIEKTGVREKLRDWEFMYIPTRTDDSRIVVLYLDPQAEAFNYKDLEPANSKDFVYPEFAECKDYTLLMLGAPVLQIELDDDQLKSCYDLARTAIEEAIETKGFTILENPGTLKNTLHGLMLARAKMVLGMVRNKFVPLACDFGTFNLSAADLRKEGREELLEYEDRLRQL